MSIRRACRALGLNRSVYAYRPKPRDDGPIIEALTSLADKYPRCGFAKLFQIIRRDGHGWSHKRVYRVYRALNLTLWRKGKKRLPSRDLHPLQRLIWPISAGRRCGKSRIAGSGSTTKNAPMSPEAT